MVYRFMENCIKSDFTLKVCLPLVIGLIVCDLLLSSAIKLDADD